MENLDTIVQIKLPTGQVVDIVDWSDLPIFSTVDMMTGFVAEELDFFQYVAGREVTAYAEPAGAAAVKRTATDADTNVATAGEMTTSEELLVYAIKPEYHFFIADPVNDFSSRSILPLTALSFPSPTATGMAVLQQQLLLRLQISEKIYAEAGLGYFNTGFGVNQQSNVTQGALNAEGAQNTATAGLASQEAVRSYTLPHHIGAQEKYRVQLINPMGLACNFGIGDAANGEDRAIEAGTMCSMRINLDGLYKRPTA